MYTLRNGKPTYRTYWHSHYHELNLPSRSSRILLTQLSMRTIHAVAQSGKRSFWGVEYFQLIKVLLQNMMFLDVSKQGQQTRMVSASDAESDIWPRWFPSCKGCYPYSSIHEWKGMESCIWWGWAWPLDRILRGAARRDQKGHASKQWTQVLAEQPSTVRFPATIASLTSLPYSRC